MITITVSNETHLKVPSQISHDTHQALLRIKDRLTFPNPKHLENVKRGFSNWNVQRELCFLEESEGGFIAPRGFTRQAIEILKSSDVPYQVNDRRRTFPNVDFTFRGTLRDYQTEAVDAILKRDFATLASPAGSGKTTMALALVARRKQPALIMVHSKELVDQWVERIEQFLGIPGSEVGRIGGGKMVIGERITVALVQSLYKCAQEVISHVGHLIVDECHRAPSRTFTEAVTAFDCRYQLGLSATPWRRDGLSRLIWFYVGDLVHQVDRGALIENGSILQAEVITRETSFRTTFNPSEQYSKMLSELTKDPERNRLIASDVAEESENSAGVCLVLSDRRAHCETLVGLLRERGIHSALLVGSMSTGDRKRVVEELNNGELRVIVATGALVGEGFDCKELSTLFLACPVKFDGRLLQYLGRILRPASGKRPKVYDYIDVNVGVLENAARARARVYG